MFSCPVCESSNYEEINGLYFCETCATLSQDLHVQESELASSKGRIIAREVRTPVTDKLFNQKYHGRPWSIYEAYQCIILAQCDALILLGANEDIKEIVFTIWANYLSRLGVAFNEAEKIVPDFILETGFGRRRELHRGTLHHALNKNLKPKVKRAKFASDPGSDVDCEDEMEERTGNKRKIESDESDESSADEESYAFVAESRKSQYVMQRPDWMNLRKTAAFCYIGLRFSNPEILPVDFLRWIYEGKIPFVSPTHVLNDDMILSACDVNLFLTEYKGCPLTMTTLIEEMDKICRLVVITSFPCLNKKAMIKLVLKKLDLPDDMANVCFKFFDKLEPRASVKVTVLTWTSYQKPEFRALKYIALTLKMMFGLDDSTENELSQYSEEAQKVIGSGGHLFVWNEWRNHQMGKERDDFDLYRDFTRERKSKYQHVDKMIETYNNLCRKNRRVFRTNFFNNETQSKMEGLAKPLEMVNLGNSVKYEKVPVETVKKPQKFVECTVSHIGDFDAFKSKYLENVDKSSWKPLKKKREMIYKKLVYESYANDDDEEVLYQKRPNSYSWMLQFLSDTIGFQAADLDAGVNELMSRLASRL